MNTAVASNTHIFLKLIVYVCLVLLSSLINEIVGVSQLSGSSKTFPLSSKIAEEYMIMKRHNKRPIFHGKDIKNCLPKGFRHASGPCRYVNNHIFGSLGCSQDKHFKQP
ncbi:hypothetical protein RND71_006627 [Anisodus tanguticus]|uniref:Uncharacterized protein n=1 Tax=Anisodus tanguticus TaxID=243964 RepID=A0AAE1SUC5_9SOLA|nr:hypothetical protein RND71_006627 [Anisodus tanguticus]